MITIRWGKEDQSILLYEFEDRWTIKDLVQALDMGVEIANRYSHDMDVIVDLSRSGLPLLEGMNVMQAFSRAAKRSDHHMSASAKSAGLVVIVSTNPIILNTLSTLLSLYRVLGNQISIASNQNEARQRIDRFRAKQVA
ncbi:MAG: hypothetical protein ACOYLB_11940 [Phototrophicaceae bacterium]